MSLPVVSEKSGSDKSGIDGIETDGNEGIAGIMSRADLKAEAQQALEFRPELKEFILVTTADDDVALDTEAAEFTDEQAKAGRDFTAQVWGWQTLLTHS